MKVSLASQKKIFWAILGVFTFLIFSIAVLDSSVETDNARIQRLRESFACPECDGQSVAESNAGVSDVISDLIEEKVKTGESDSDIRDFLIENYSAAVLLNPSSDGVWLFVWIAPAIVLLLGGFVVVRSVFPQLFVDDKNKLMLVIFLLIALGLIAGFGLSRVAGERGVDELITGDIAG